MKMRTRRTGNLFILIMLCVCGAISAVPASAAGYTVSHVPSAVLHGEGYTLQATDNICSGEKEYKSTQTLEIWFEDGYSASNLPPTLKTETIQYWLFAKQDHFLARFDEDGFEARLAEEGEKQYVKLTYRALEAEPIAPFLCAEGYSVRYIDGYGVDFMLTNPYDQSFDGRREMMVGALEFYRQCSGIESQRSPGDLDTVLLAHPRAFNEDRKAAELDAEVMNRGYLRFELADPGFW